MQHITGTSRGQMHISSLEDVIFPDNQIRIIDSFVRYIGLSKLGFTAKVKEVQRGWLNYFRGTSIMGKLRDLDGWLRF